jgi:Cu(I)/Ag(I) efflux system membrane protein CusA/SilA
VSRAKEAVKAQVHIPTAYTLQWSGQYENMIRVRERLQVVVPVALFLIYLILYMNTKSMVKASIVMLAVPFSAIGAIWLLYFLGYNLSIAVWVGLIALMGLDAETGVFMLLFLDMSYADQIRAGKMKTFEDLTEAVIHGAVKRIRPKLMTVACAFIGLVPIMFSQGTGADMMKRVAAPLMGGLVTSFILELLVYPAIYVIWKWRFEMKKGAVDVSKLSIPELRMH